MVYRLILPDWTKAENQNLPKVVEGEIAWEAILDYNSTGYNVYYLPNYPEHYDSNTTVDGSHIDKFEYVFVDMDLKSGDYSSKEDFFEVIPRLGVVPSKIVDSGNGVHVYWRVSDLDANSFLRLQRRLCRFFNTDEAVSKIYQLMRVPGTINTKLKDTPKRCELLYEEDHIYTCEQISNALPPISVNDEAYCVQHYNKTYNIEDLDLTVNDILPLKFCQLIKNNKEVKEIWSQSGDDRSGADYRLGHIMFASGFTKEEATSVLVNAAKALSRAPKHRISYAKGIIDKIWTYELTGTTKLSNSVKDILSRGEAAIKGTRFACSPLIDDTETGFRLGHVIGLVAGSGVGKTAMAINMFLWFTERNPEYEHFFVSLEQPENEIAARWNTITQGDSRLNEKVHVLSNYDENGKFRHLSLDNIKDYIMEFQAKTKKKIGTVVIDHIGALKKENRNGENQALVDICHQMKGFAVETNTMVVMQSQAPREKAGIGDIELNKDSAYGTVFFESYVDYLLCIWQPLKRAYKKGAPTVMAFKYGKIRHKKQGLDRIQEDVCYQLLFDSQTERLRELTETEEKAAKYFLSIATNDRKQDKKTELVEYNSRKVEPNVPTAETDTHLN